MDFVKRIIDIDYTSIKREERRRGTGSTQEFFTPFSIVDRMCAKVSSEEWADPDKTFLEPSFGNGNFLVYIIYKRISSGLTWQQTLSTLYGVELMADNVQETKERICELLDKMDVKYDKAEAMSIMDKNLVCSDFFEWDFENWRPLNSSTEEALF